jgi:hypothetical protein
MGLYRLCMGESGLDPIALRFTRLGLPQRQQAAYTLQLPSIEETHLRSASLLGPCRTGEHSLQVLDPLLCPATALELRARQRLDPSEHFHQLQLLPAYRLSPLAQPSSALAAPGHARFALPDGVVGVHCFVSSDHRAQMLLSSAAVSRAGGRRPQACCAKAFPLAPMLLLLTASALVLCRR